MSNFKTMKIKVNDTNRELVRLALVHAGYEPEGKMLNNAIYQQADGFYTYGEDYVLCSLGEDTTYFERHSHPEHWLQNGEFVDKSYWTQPATAKIPERYKNPVTDADKAMKDAYDEIVSNLKPPADEPPYFFTIHGPESEQFKKAQKEVYDRTTGYTETTYEPLPLTLKPRSEFLHERNVDILKVMLEYAAEGKRIPDTIISELSKNNEEIYGNDF